MNRKQKTLRIAAILFVAVFIFAGCQQPMGNGDNESREGAFNKDSLLIEVWDSSTPPKFLGYDTGLGNERSRPIILTSNGYCVELRSITYGDYKYMAYGRIAPMDQGLDSDELDEIIENNGWGYAIFFTTTANPTVNDTPYAFGNSNIINDVIYNPNNGGTYYTVDRNAPPTNMTIQGNYKFYDNTGAIRTWNDDCSLGEQEFNRTPTSDFIGESFYLLPFKRIGGYTELGLPNPDDIIPPFVYKVQ